jgi:hypothetical protein
MRYVRDPSPSSRANRRGCVLAALRRSRRRLPHALNASSRATDHPKNLTLTSWRSEVSPSRTTGLHPHTKAFRPRNNLQKMRASTENGPRYEPLAVTVTRYHRALVGYFCLLASSFLGAFIHFVRSVSHFGRFLCHSGCFLCNSGCFPYHSGRFLYHSGFFICHFGFFLCHSGRFVSHFGFFVDHPRPLIGHVRRWATPSPSPSQAYQSLSNIAPPPSPPDQIAAKTFPLWEIPDRL